MLDFPPNWTFAIQFVGFFVLLAILDRLLFRPFSEILDRREASTHGTAREAEGDRKAAAELRARIEAGIADAKAEAHAKAETIRKGSQAEEAAIFEEAKAQAAGRLAELRKALDQEVVAAREALSADARALADDMVVALLRSRQ